MFRKIRPYPKAEDILQEIPVPGILKKIKDARDQQIRQVFEGKSNKFLLIIGPCSADNVDAVCEYTSRLSLLQEKVKERLLIIPRIYTNKPRTTAMGYKGMMHQPSPTGESDYVQGVRLIRQLHIRAMDESHLSPADEMLYPGNYPYLADVLSYVAIGARSVENQEHRLTCSGLNIPVGMKNPTSGDIEVMFNSIKAAQADHTFIYNGWEVETEGNPLAHGVLRGAVNRFGQHIPNYHYEDLMMTTQEYEKRQLINNTLIIDTNHSNSQKQYDQQPRIAREVLLNRRLSPLLQKMIKGFMVESYLVDGAQKIAGDVFGQSITDPCLGWEKTEEMVLQIADLLS